MIENILNQLTVEESRKFSAMLGDPTQSYKFYWLEALIKLRISKKELLFEAIINEMIFNAWYSVAQYHVNLGPFIDGKPSSYLEIAVKEIQAMNLVQFGDSPEKIKEAIAIHDKELRRIKTQLAKNVPYRILSPFLNLGGNDSEWNSHKKVIEIINSIPGIFYKIEYAPALQKKVIINPRWDDFILKNANIILGWIQFKKIKFIQARNPGVPCIPNKLDAPQQNKDIQAVRDLWKYVVGKTKIIDMYKGGIVDMDNSDVDHFIPWTYVCCDELWNLAPTNSSLNRSKSNSLPDWDLYFSTFSENQYSMYCLILKDKKARELFNNCKEKNLYSLWANELLYSGEKDKISFITILKENMKPIYDSAKMLGYDVWNNSMYKGDEL